jgi:hypothetical protein
MARALKPLLCRVTLVGRPDGRAPNHPKESGQMFVVGENRKKYAPSEYFAV